MSANNRFFVSHLLVLPVLLCTVVMYNAPFVMR